MGVSGQRQPLPRFSPGERTPGTHCTGGWVGPRAGLNTEAVGKILFASAGDRTSIVVERLSSYCGCEMFETVPFEAEACLNVI
jgi:hypothetical protein